MDPKLLLLLMSERLYEDIRFVTEQNPTQIVDDDGARAYNALLAKTQKYFSHIENVQDFPQWSARTIKYKDALVVAGQLAAMIRALVQPQTAAQGAAGDVRPMVADPNIRHEPMSPVCYEEELFGSSAPPKRNEDGTIPFSLE